MGLLKKLFGGGSHTVTVMPARRQFTVAGGQSILEAALAQGIAFPHSCTVGTCGSCKCRLVDGRIRESANFAYVLDAAELQAGVILACQAAPRSDVTLDVPGLSDKQLPPAGDYTGELVGTQDLTTDIRRVTIALDRPLRFEAGQYAQLSVAGVWGARAYSFACAPAPEGDREVTFFIRHVPGGAFTDLLFAGGLVGKPLKVHGPAGNFWLRDSRAPMICIAGGSGLAPIHALLQDAQRRQVGRPCVVLFGARTAADLYAGAEIAAIGATWNGPFTFTQVLSHEPPDSAWTGPRGLVTEAIAAHASPFVSAETAAYLCGPPPMIDAAIPVLTALGLDTGHIHCDRFLDGSHGLHRQG